MLILLMQELSKMGSWNLIYEIEKGRKTIGRVNCPDGLSGVSNREHFRILKVGPETERPTWLSAPQGWRRHSASIGYRPHPGNHIHRWQGFYSKSTCGQQKKWGCH